MVDHEGVRRALATFTDAFGNQISLGTTNEADLASHYAYSQERYRVFVDGVRQQIQYDGFPTQFTDNPDSFSLEPQADGEVVTLKTAERYRYVVQYVIQWSLAFQINQDLQAGDVWAVGYGNPDLENSTDDTPGPNADGWFVYQNSSNASDEVVLAEYRDGAEVDTATTTLTKLPQTWGRLAGNTNWYNVGETKLTETYVGIENLKKAQQNDTVATVGVEDGKGPILGNQPVTASVKTGASGAGSLELEVGSIGVRTFGNVTGILRTKTFDFEQAYEGTAGEFEPLLAIRVDPDRREVNTQFSVLEPLEFSQTDDLVLIANIFDKDNVLDTNGDPLVDGDYSTPPELSTLNSVIETSDAVAQVVDSTGTPQTSMTDPGGYQVAYGSLTSSGAGGQGNARVSSRARTQKRAVPNGDVAVIMARSDSTGTINGDVQFEQDW